MENWATILDIVEAGIAGNKERCRAYAELLRDRISQQEEGQQKAQRLQNILDGKKGMTFGVEPWFYNDDGTLRFK